jgi:hypothetical protein
LKTVTIILSALALLIAAGAATANARVAPSNGRPGLAENGARVTFPQPAPTAMLGINDASLSPALLSLAASRGVRIVRRDIVWSQAQPHAGQPYNWSAADAAHRELVAAGMQWHVIVGGAPLWAGARGGGAAGVFPDPQHIPQYVAFAVAVVKRYHPLYLEVGNEPDGSYLVSGYPTPAQYETIFKAVRTAVKRAVPQTKVLMAGLAQQPYADAFYRLAGSQISDGVNIHTYTCPTTIALWAQGVWEETRYPIVDSEYGWTADGSTPVCPRLVGASFYEPAQAALLQVPHVELVEPYVWAGSSDDLINDIRALGPSVRRPPSALMRNDVRSDPSPPLCAPTMCTSLDPPSS